MTIVNPNWKKAPFGKSEKIEIAWNRLSFVGQNVALTLAVLEVENRQVSENMPVGPSGVKDISAKCFTIRQIVETRFSGRWVGLGDRMTDHIWSVEDCWPK